VEQARERIKDFIRRYGRVLAVAVAALLALLVLRRLRRLRVLAVPVLIGAILVISVLISRSASLMLALPVGIFPNVVSCVQENPNPGASDPHWQPTLRVKVEPVRDPGRVREYRVLGCRLYYYHAHFR
jgi:hypothetical protein